MKIIGLTGSIGMGKSEAARMLRKLGIPVFDADAVVHKLLSRNGGAVPLIQQAFPDYVQNGIVNRQALGRKVFADIILKKQLEAIMHPLVRAEKRQFLKQMWQRYKPLVVLDIPLLFETGWERECDAVMVVTAPAFLQRQRVLKREGMTEQKFHAILANQMPNTEKCRHADAIIHTGLGKRISLQQIRNFLDLNRHKA